MTKDNYIITIARQFGSLGRPISKKMSEMLGIGYYDRDIVDKAAETLNLPRSIVDEKEESALKVLNTNTRFGRMAYPLGKGTSDVQDQIFNAQENIIKFLVERESCIVVGRCGDFILSDHPNCIHIYIYASYESRIKNSVDALGLTQDEAKKMIQDVDEARDSYHIHYSGFKPNNINFKDIMIDSSLLGVDGTAECLVNIIQKKFNL